MPNISDILPFHQKLSQCKSLISSIKCNECHAKVLLTRKLKESLWREMLVHDVLEDDNNCFYYTGIPTVDAFQTIFSFISPSIINMYSGKGKKTRRKLDNISQFMVTLLKIRRGYDNRFLVKLFSVSKTQIAEIWIKWIPFLDECFRPLIIWPSKEVCKAQMPQFFLFNPQY